MRSFPAAKKELKDVEKHRELIRTQRKQSGLKVAATKAFLLSYTQTLHYELSPAGIHVTAVCPYWVKDTEFIGIAEKGGHGFRHYPLASRSQDVVRRALRDSALNLRVSTPGLVCTLHRAAAKVTPNLLCLPLADWLSHV